MVDLDSQGAGYPSTNFQQRVTAISDEIGNISHAPPAKPFGVTDGAFETASTNVALKVAALLNGPDAEFGRFYRPPEINPQVLGIIENAAKNFELLEGVVNVVLSSIGLQSLSAGPAGVFRFELTPPVSEPLRGGVSWYVEVFGTNGVSSDGVSWTPDPADSRKVTVQVNAATRGQVVLYTTYYSTSGKTIVCAPIKVVTQTGGATLTRIAVEPPEIALPPDSDPVSMELWGIFTDGQAYRLHVSPGEITSTSSNPSVATADELEVNLRQTGSSTIQIAYQGKSTQVSVTVSDNALQAPSDAPNTTSPVPPGTGWVVNSANGHYYRVIHEANWKNAQAAAAALGANLATVRNAAENSWLATQFGNEMRWIGLTDEANEGIWRWVSGEPFTFNQWFSGEPNNLSLEPGSNGEEDYAVINWGSPGSWNDVWRTIPWANSGIIEWIAPAPSAPILSVQPQSQTVAQGSSVHLSVSANGAAPFSYQWRKNGANIAGATAASHTIASAQGADAGTYSVTVSNAGGSTVSRDAILTVNTPVAPSITSHPQNQTVTAGQSVTFNVVATGDPAPAYQWRKNGVNITGASTATYRIPSAQASDAGSYSVFVSNSAGSKTSMSAVLTVETVPVLPTINVLQPSDAIIASTANSPASEGVANAIDHSRAKYLNFDMANDAIPSGFIVTPAVGPTIITGISIQSANDSPERDPRSFTLDGSNDADASYARGTWTTIYSNANVPDWSMTFPGDTRYQTQTFYFSNTTAYKSYRWMVQHTQGPSLCCMQIAELGLLTATQSTVAPVSQVSAGISASPSVGGSVSGGGTVNSGSSATVSATPAGGYTFANWTENGIVVSTSPSYTFTAIANRTLVANFAVSNPAPAPNTSKLLAYWDFNTAGNSTAALDKVKSYSAALQNGVVYTTDGAGWSGKKGDRGVDFGTGSGVNRQIRISTAAFTSAFNAAAAKDQVTVSYWIKWNRGVAASSAFWFSSPKSLPDQRGMQAHSPYGNNVIYFDTAGCCTSNTQRIDKNVTTSLPNFNWQTWHHFAFVKSNAVKQIWIDGTLFHSGAGASPLPTDFNDFLIGHSIVPASDNVRAVMDDFAIYGSALSAASVKALSSGTSPLEIESSAPQVAPSITAHPQSQSVSTGQSVTFSVQATGTPAPTYQWQKDNVNLPGQTSSMLTLSNVKESDAGRYTVVVSNAAGSLTSGGAVLSTSSPLGPQSVVVDCNTNPFASGQVKVFGNNPQPWKSTGGVNNSGYLALTDATASQSTVVVFPDYLNGAGYQGFHFSMDVRIGNGTTDRTADGLSLSLARSNDPVIGSGTGFAGEQIESGTTTGLAISFDTWSGNALPDGLDVEGLIVRADNKTLRRVPLPTRNGACGDITSVQTGPVALTAPGSPNGLCWERVEVDLSSDSRLTIKYKGKTLVDRLETGYSPSARSRWILGARTGGANENHHVDNIRIGPSESVEPPPAPMTPPTLSDIADQTITQATAVTVALTVRDAETAPDALTLTAASSNPSLLPLANITFGGTGTERTVTLAPNLSQSGAVTVTITVGDGSGLSTRKSFVLTVTPQAVGPPTTGGGTVQFNNRLPGSVDARVTMQDGTGVGSGWTAQLAVVNSTGTVTPVTPTTTFRTSTAAATGYVNPIDLPVPNTVPGSTITLVLRAYNGGAFESSTLRGQSQPINVVLGGVGSPPSPPNALAGLSGFVVAAPASPSAKPFVERQLPSGYSPGKTLTVLLKASPPNDANVYDVDDSPPNRWAVGNVSAGGSYDGVNNKVKWGPFFDGTARTLTYEVTPLVGESGAKLFAGSSAIDGARVPVAGASTLDVIVVKLHPADNNPGDSQITIAELTAYGGAWQNGSRWPTDPNPIPIDYVTVAGNLWKNGEFYTVDPSVSTAPQWWVNLPGKAGLQGFARSGSTLSGGSIVGSLSPLFVRGETLLVQISVQPATGVSAYAVQDQIPQGWTVTQVSEGGAVDPSAGQVKWGPFLDSRARQLHYTLGAPTDSSETAQLQGAASFDGSSNAITGQRQSRASIRLGALQPLPNGSGQFELPATGRLGGKWILQASSDLLNWVEIGTTVNTDGNIRFRDLSHALTGPRFYRAVAQ